MRNLISLTALTALIAIGVASAASAELVCENTCGSPQVDAVRQGRHSADESADGVLWPPNHKFRGVTLSNSMNQQGDSCDINIGAVRQDESTTGFGSGGPTHCPDAKDINNTNGTSSSVQLRGERTGTNGEDESAGGMGTGRYYHVQYSLVDPDCATPEQREALILVPHDQGIVHVGTWVDEGPLYDSTSCTGL